ncbi:MAG: trehalose-phosphatase [Acidobacteria bacterium]|nr:trehalose-phosphatase [Acidobacteriota bacterium]
MQGLLSIDHAFEEIELLVHTVQKHADDLILVLVGFDGVLAEYEDDPEVVRLSAARRGVLRRLIHQPGVALGVISGRRARDLRQRVGLDNVFYIGLRGLEVVGPGFTRSDQQTFKQYRQRLRDIAAETGPLISQIEGAHLEDKEAVLALHTRQANSSDAVWARLRLLSTAAEITDLQTFRVRRGNHVLELLPNIGSTKAVAIAAVRDFLEQREGRPVFAVYNGEDVAEDDAYEAIAGHGVAAAVGRRAAQVEYHLESIEMVDRLLVRLAALREPGKAHQRS